MPTRDRKKPEARDAAVADSTADNPLNREPLNVIEVFRLSRFLARVDPSKRDEWLGLPEAISAARQRLRAVSHLEYLMSRVSDDLRGRFQILQNFAELREDPFFTSAAFYDKMMREFPALENTIAMLNHTGGSVQAAANVLQETLGKIGQQLERDERAVVAGRAPTFHADRLDALRQTCVNLLLENIVRYMEADMEQCTCCESKHLVVFTLLQDHLDLVRSTLPDGESIVVEQKNSWPWVRGKMA